MKKLALFLSVAAISLGFSSCCSMFGVTSPFSGSRTETKQVKACGYDTVIEEVHVPGDAKSGMGATVQTIEKKVPRYRTNTKKTWSLCGSSIRFFCPKKDCGGTTSDSALKMTTTQSATGSPHIGLVPSMKTLAP